MSRVQNPPRVLGKRDPFRSQFPGRAQPEQFGKLVVTKRFAGQAFLELTQAQGLAKLFGGVDEGHADQFPDREIIGK